MRLFDDDANNPLKKIKQIGDDDDDRISNIEHSIDKIAKNQKDLTKNIRIKSTILIGAVATIIVVMALVMTQILIPITNWENQGILHNEITSGYVIENLKGDVINTWVSWKIEPADVFHIHVIDSPDITQEQLDMINDVVFSTETVSVKGETYYKGWYGALHSSSYTTKFPIPIHYHSMITNTGSGHITIKLTTKNNGDGYSGFTKSQVDEVNHQILKSQITIYSVDKLSTVEFKAILRHELGHALGLAHSEDPNDLMFPTIETNYPYISSCNIQGINKLYDGAQKSEIICQ